MILRKEKTYRFIVDLHCRLANGERDWLKGWEVAVDEQSTEDARRKLNAVAHEMVSDLGSDSGLEAPLDYLTVHNIRRTY